MWEDLLIVLEQHPGCTCILQYQRQQCLILYLCSSLILCFILPACFSVIWLLFCCLLKCCHTVFLSFLWKGLWMFASLPQLSTVSVFFLPLVVALDMFWQCEWLCHLQLVHAPANVSAAPAQATPSKVAQPTGASTAADDGGIDSDLQARLDNLRKMWGDFQICGGSGGDILLFYKWDSPIHGWHLLWLTLFRFWHFNVWYTCSYASPSDDKTLIFVSFSSVLTNCIITWGAAHGWSKNLLSRYE